MKTYPECDIHRSGDYTLCDTCYKAWHYTDDKSEYVCPLAEEFEARAEALAPSAGIINGILITVLFWLFIACIGYGGFAFVQWLNKDLGL